MPKRCIWLLKAWPLNPSGRGFFWVFFLPKGVFDVIILFIKNAKTFDFTFQKVISKGVFGVVDLATKSNSPSGRGPWGSETARTQKLKSTVIIFKSLFPRWP